MQDFFSSQKYLSFEIESFQGWRKLNMRGVFCSVIGSTKGCPCFVKCLECYSVDLTCVNISIHIETTACVLPVENSNQF